MRRQETLSRRVSTLDDIPDDLFAEFGLHRGSSTAPSYRCTDPQSILVPVAEITAANRARFAHLCTPGCRAYFRAGFNHEGDTTMCDKKIDLSTTTVAELVALDPPSGGTKSARNPLTTADLIVARFSDGSESVVYGRDRLEKISKSGDTAKLLTVRVQVRDNELEILCAMVDALRGHHDFVSVTEHTYHAHPTG